jgi:hypothetical protein
MASLVSTGEAVLYLGEIMSHQETITGHYRSRKGNGQRDASADVKENMQTCICGWTA